MKRATLIVAAALLLAACEGGEQQELKSELAGLTKLPQASLQRWEGSLSSLGILQAPAWQQKCQQARPGQEGAVEAAWSASAGDGI